MVNEFTNYLLYNVITLYYVYNYVLRIVNIVVIMNVVIFHQIHSRKYII